MNRLHRALLDALTYWILLLFALVQNTIVVPVYEFYLARKSKALFAHFNNKTILITGASSGIGKAIALRLSAVGAKLIICSRNVKELDLVSRQCKAIQIQGRYQPFCLSLRLDLEDYENIEPSFMVPMISSLTDLGHDGKIDILINNAGVSSRGLALDTEVAALQKVMAVNFFGPVELTKRIVNRMLTQSVQGSVCFISSIQGKLAIPFRTSYAASKHALQAYCDGLRAELAGQRAAGRMEKDKGIKVTVISPGYVNTPLSMHAINPNNTRYGITDQSTATGMSPDQVAHEILLSIAWGESDVMLADWFTCMAVHVRSLLPGLTQWIMERRAASELSRQKKERLDSISTAPNPSENKKSN